MLLRRATRPSRHWIRNRRTRSEERRFTKETAKFWPALEQFGINADDLPCTRTAHRVLSLSLGATTIWALGAVAVSTVIVVLVMPIVSWGVWAIADRYGLGILDQVASYVFVQWSKVPNTAAPGRDPVFAGSVQAGGLAFGLWFMWRRLDAGAMRKYWLTQRTSAAIVRCAEAKRARENDRPDSLLRVDSLAQAIEWSLWRAHYWRGGMTRRSSRRIAARQHAAVVIGALHRQLDRLDEGRDDALDELAKMLAKIGEQHAAGQVAALLPPGELEGVAPASIRGHAVRESLAIVRGIAAALIAVFVLDRVLPGLGVSDGLDGWFQAGGALIAAVFAVGWNRVRDFLSIFTGM